MSRSFLDGFSDHVAERPQATALVWHGERISYSELYERAARVSAALRAMHLPRSQPVAIVAEKSPTAIGLMLGCLMAELCFVLPSVQLPGAIRRMLLESARCSAILRQEAGTNDGSESFAIDLVQPSANEAGTSSLPNFDEIAVILTTSGSTGVPKLVPLPIPAIERFTDWACNRFDFGPDKTVLNYAPLNFDLCFLEIWATLKAGGRVALVDPRYGANGEQLLGIYRRPTLRSSRLYRCCTAC